MQNLETRPNSFFREESYLKSSAQAKQDALWQNVMSTAHTSSSYFSMNPVKPTESGIMLEPMDCTFSTKGDTMPFGRYKFIHNVGTVAKVEFVPVANQYSGIFKGAQKGLVRFSSAAEPSNNIITSVNPMASWLGPGMGLKFLRDGVDSANLVAMYSVDG